MMFSIQSFSPTSPAKQAFNIRVPLTGNRPIIHAGNTDVHMAVLMLQL